MAVLTLNDGDELYYETHGEDGDAPPLLLVSGLGGISGFWTPHVERLSAHRRLVLHDHRGTGRSTPSQIDYSVEQMAADVIELMDHLDIEQADFLGHSTGGAIGQVIALDHPGRINRLVLSSTWAGHDPYFELLFEGCKRILQEVGDKAYMQSLLMAAYPPGWIRDNWQAIANVSPEDVKARVPDLHCGVSRIDAILRYDRRVDMEKIDVPTLVICARDDAVTPAYLSEELAGLIPDAELRLLDGGGHFYPTTEPEAFQCAVEAFLSVE